MLQGGKRSPNRPLSPEWDFEVGREGDLQTPSSALARMGRGSFWTWAHAGSCCRGCWAGAGSPGPGKAPCLPSVSRWGGMRARPWAAEIPTSALGCLQALTLDVFPIHQPNCFAKICYNQSATLAKAHRDRGARGAGRDGPCISPNGYLLFFFYYNFLSPPPLPATPDGCLMIYLSRLASLHRCGQEGGGPV